jgi:threonyl-tRNA synthetase
MLQRIYGTAWATKDELQQYLTMLEEAEKRDHRKLGRELDLFHIDEHSARHGVLAPQGLDGLAGGRAVHAPGVPRQRLPGGQGPADPGPGPVGEDGPLGQVPRQHVHDRESEKRDYALKPMNCPGHILIFKQGIKSYRDLPLRYGEFGQCHRNEPTGGLHGIMRVRGFTQDDGHIFCTEDMILARVRGLHGAAAEGLCRLRLHRHHLQGGHAARAAHRLRRELGQGRARADGEPARVRLRFRDLPGDGAFYGPKIEYTLKDAHRPPVAVRHDAGRLQHARAAGRRIRGRRRRRATGPVMLHRAIVGSLERFIGILIEQHAGALPAWLAPVQVVVLNITDAQADYARKW